MTSPKQTLATQCYHKLLESILKGERLPGSKLLCEDLKLDYEVGMSPVREALAKLTASRLVSFEEHKGYRVSSLSHQQVQEDIICYAEIECIALKQAIMYGDEHWEGAILAALHKLRKNPGISFERQFFNALISACPLKTLLEIRSTLAQRYDWYKHLSCLCLDKAQIQAIIDDSSELAKLAIERQTQLSLEKLYWFISSRQTIYLEALSKQGFLRAC